MAEKTMTLNRLGKYEILEPLGSGATAEVLRAREPALGRDVALKILKPALVADPSAFERFVQEAQAAAGLFHANIATVLDMGEADGRFFLAMRLIPGQSLDKMLKEKGPLSWEQTLRLAGQIGSALDFAHKQGFLHRDVKPSNILCSPEGDFVLTDFGLQRAMMSTGLTSHSGAVLGTPAYIAPEVWDGKPALPATDQYALACVVYEALTGEVLFAGETPMAVLKRHSQGWSQPARWPAGVPEGTEAVLQKALAKEPAERHTSLAEFAQALEHANREAEQGRAETARLTAEARKKKARDAGSRSIPPGGHPAGLTFWQRWGAWLGAGGAGLAGMAVITLLAIWASGNLRPEQPAASATPTDRPAETQTQTSTETPTLPAEPPTQTSEPTFTFTPTPEIGSTWVRSADGMVMVYVPEGEFTMGSNYGQAVEQPVHTVFLDGYWIDQTEVTNAMYQKCVEAGDCVSPGYHYSHTRGIYYGNPYYTEYPVIYVTWEKASTYCAWAGARLPSEAEWEKAARGTDGRAYPWGNSFPTCLLVNININNGIGGCEGDTTKVGSHPAGASPYGALDMGGNVWEWVNDWYGETYYAQSPASNPTGPSSGFWRVLRGGAWNFDEHYVRSSYRNYNDPGNEYDYIVGFRCARSQP